MRKTREELLEQFPTWNEEKNDIVKTFYGDMPLFHYDEKAHERQLYWEQKSGTVANIGAVDDYKYMMNGCYDKYRTLMGDIDLFENDTIMAGEIIITNKGKKIHIHLNTMYGLNAMDILYLGSKVKGWSNKDGIGSPSRKASTEELSDERIKEILDTDLSDYGIAVEKFIKVCKELYNKDNTNYIMEKCFSL